MGDIIFEIPDLTKPVFFVVATAILFVIIVGRYLLVAGLFYAVYFLRNPAKVESRKLNGKAYKPGQLKTEITWSNLTSLIFAIAGTLTAIAWQNGYTLVYTELRHIGWWYLPISLVAAMFFQETYYYWTHRLMHHPTIFRLVHKVHHDSHTTSPFTAFSFHPLEGLIQAMTLPLTLMLIPMHPYTILVNLTLMTFSSVINHLNLEIYPDGFYKNAIGKWVIGATHHAMHHKRFGYNFGLYFTFWDKFANTDSSSIGQVQKQKTKYPRQTNKNVPG